MCGRARLCVAALTTCNRGPIPGLFILVLILGLQYAAPICVSSHSSWRQTFSGSPMRPPLPNTPHNLSNLSFQLFSSKQKRKGKPPPPIKSSLLCTSKDCQENCEIGSSGCLRQRVGKRNAGLVWLRVIWLPTLELHLKLTLMYFLRDAKVSARTKLGVILELKLFSCAYKHKAICALCVRVCYLGYSPTPISCSSPSLIVKQLHVTWSTKTG